MPVEQIGLDRTYSKRDLFKIPLLVASLGLLAACNKPSRGTPVPPTAAPTASKPPETTAVTPAVSRPVNPGSYPLEEDGVYIVDKPLPTSRYPYLESLKFAYDPSREGGSLVMEPSFRQVRSEFRIIVQEIDTIDPANYGYIYCKSSKTAKGFDPDHPYIPVIRFEPKEEYTIYLGFRLQGQPCSNTYRAMRTYYITRDSGGLTGRFDGVKTIDPDDPLFKPRDYEAAKYWQKNCLS